MSLQFPVEHEFQEGFGCALEYDLRLCFRNLPSRLFYRICSSGGFFFFYLYVAEMPCSIRFLFIVLGYIPKSTKVPGPLKHPIRDVMLV